MAGPKAGPPARRAVAGPLVPLHHLESTSYRRSRMTRRGRVVLVVRQKEAGAPPPAAVQAATSLHFRGARVLFERDGFGIVEALKGQPTSA